MTHSHAQDVQLLVASTCFAFWGPRPLSSLTPIMVLVRTLERCIALRDGFFVASLYDFWGTLGNGRSELLVYESLLILMR